MNLSLRQEMYLAPQMSEVAQLAKICRQNAKDIIEIFKRKKRTSKKVDGEHIYESRYSRYDERDIAESVHDADRELDYLMGYNGLTPKEYLQSYPQNNSDTANQI